jgi:hypothetical protein
MATPRTGRPRGRPKGTGKPRITGRPSGRPKGSISRSTKAILEAAAAKSITPLEVILQNMRRHLKARRWAEAERSAALAAPYMHPKLAATTVTVRPSISEMTDEELNAAAAEAESAANIAEELRRRMQPGTSTTKH